MRINLRQDVVINICSNILLRQSPIIREGWWQCSSWQGGCTGVMSPVISWSHHTGSADNLSRDTWETTEPETWLATQICCLAGLEMEWSNVLEEMTTAIVFIIICSSWLYSWCRKLLFLCWVRNVKYTLAWCCCLFVMHTNKPLWCKLINILLFLLSSVSPRSTKV